MTSQDRFVDVIRYMLAHLGDKLTRDDLASLVHLHPGYFDRIFHNVYGTSPMQMLRNLRLSRARQLLETTDAPLSAIALSCGLSDAGYFNRVFRQCYGQTPGQYRQSAKSTMQSYIPTL
jgi:transcriptional regulator GlxA family with amidase domain